MIELIWSPQSVADVAEIRSYIATDSQLYADLTVQRIVAAVERLRAFPDLGRIYPEGMPREVQVALGLAALVVNLAIYAFVWSRARPRGRTNRPSS